MPELPEVRAHAERLTASHAGRPLTGFRALSFATLKTVDPPPDAAIGTDLLDVTTRGKLLLLRFEPVTFVVHLMQGGRLRPDEKVAPKPRGGLARWTFGPNAALLLTEAGTERKAGVWVIRGDPLTQAPLARLGPDADQVRRDALGALLGARSMRLHGLLRSQDVIAGIGRRLANEVCFRAQLSPFANTARLDEGQVARLHAAIAYCIDESLRFERGLDEMSTSKDRPGAVHGRRSLPCVTCGTPVQTVEYRSYTVAYCPTCQTEGKLLADNTTSKFLK